LPLGYTTLAAGNPTWYEAVVPGVSPEEEAEIESAYKEVTARWDPNLESDMMLKPVREIKTEVLG
jgi:hypothetical protein